MPLLLLSKSQPSKKNVRILDYVDDNFQSKNKLTAKLVQNDTELPQYYFL